MHGCAFAVRWLCNSLSVLGRSRSITHVMTAASIAAGKGGGYARYLESKTLEPERGELFEHVPVDLRSGVLAHPARKVPDPQAADAGTGVEL